MRKKTKFLTILLIAAIALFAATNTAASCKKDPPKNEHVCSFEKTWTYDQTEHWHKCIGEGECDKVSDKAAHTWNDGKVTKEPTYTEKGEKTYTCTVCPATKTEELPIKQHVCSFEDAWTYNQAEHWHKCIGEGAAPCDKVSEKAAHTWNNGEVTKEPTYTEKGEKTYTCTVCPATKTEELPVKQHVCSFEKTWTYNQTEHWHKCIGEGECDKVSDKAAHTWNDGEVTKEPTYTEKGEKTYTCTVCPATKTEETASVPLPDENEAWEKMQSLAKKAKENDSYGVRVYGGRSDTLDQGTYKQEFVFNADGKSASKVYAVEEEGTFTSYTALMQYGGKYYRAEAVSESSAFTVIEVKEITEYFAKTSASTSRNMLARFIGSKEDLTDYLIEQVYSALYWMCDKDGNPVNVTKEDITTKITVKGSENKIIIAITATVDPEKVKKMWYEGLSFTSYESTVSFTFGDDAFCKFEYSNDNGYVKDGKAGSLRGVQSIEVLAEPDYELYDQAVKAADLSNVDLSKVEPYTVNVRVYNDIYAHKLDHVTDFDAAVTDDAYKALQKEAHDIIYKINVYFKENLTARFYADENKTVPIDENYKFGYVCSDLGLITTVYIDISPADKTKVLATYTYEKRSVSEDGSSNSQTRNEYVLVDKNSDYEIATGYMYEYFDDEITVNGEKITDKKVKVGEKNLTIHCLKLLGPDEDTNFITNHVNCTESDEYGFDENNHWKKCTAYGCDNKLKLGAHQWDAGEIISQPSEDRKGVKKFTCTVCGYEKTEEFTVEVFDEDEAWQTLAAVAKTTLSNGNNNVKYTITSSDSSGATMTETFTASPDGKAAGKTTYSMTGMYGVEYEAVVLKNGKYYHVRANGFSDAPNVKPNNNTLLLPVSEYYAKSAPAVTMREYMQYVLCKNDVTDALLSHRTDMSSLLTDKSGKSIFPSENDIIYSVSGYIDDNGITHLTVVAKLTPEFLAKSLMGGDALKEFSYSFTYSFDKTALYSMRLDKSMQLAGINNEQSVSGYSETVLFEIPARFDSSIYDEAAAAVLPFVIEEQANPGTINVPVVINGYHSDHITPFFADPSKDSFTDLTEYIANLKKIIERDCGEKVTVKAYYDGDFTRPIENSFRAEFDGHLSSSVTGSVYLDVRPENSDKTLVIYLYEKRLLEEYGMRTIFEPKYAVADKNSVYTIQTVYKNCVIDDIITVNGRRTSSLTIDLDKTPNPFINCAKYVTSDEEMTFEISHVNCTESDEYGFDENNHWKKCTLPTCDNKLKLGAHQWDGGVIIEEATEEKPGVKKYTCEICGYDKNQSYTITPDVPEPEDPSAAAFEKMLAAAEKMRKNKPAAVKKNFNYITPGARMSTETIAFADGRSARLSSTVYGTMEMTTPSYTDVIDGNYVEKTLTNNGNSYSVTISPVTEYYAKNAHSAIIEQLLAFCRNKEASKALYFSVMQSFLDLGVFDDATDNFFVLSESDIEYWVTIASGEGYDLITISITLTDQCMKSIHGGAGERLSMGTLNVTIKYTENAITDITYYQGFTYSLEGQTVTSEFIYEYSASDDANMTLFNQVKAEVDKQTTTVQAEKRISGSIYVSGVHLESFTCGVTKGSLYSAVAPTIKAYAESLEEIAPGRFVVEAYMDQDYTIPLTADSEAGYSEDMSPLSVYLKVRSVSGNECIAMYKYWTSSSDMMFSMNSRLDGEKTVIFTKSDNYKLETTYNSVNYTDLIRINNSATKSTVLDASGENDLFVIECHKRGNPSQNGDSSEITG